MLYAGDDATAKATVGALLTSLGWDAVDAGPLANSLQLEHTALLWIKCVCVVDVCDVRQAGVPAGPGPRLHVGVPAPLALHPCMQSAQHKHTPVTPA